MSFHFHSFSFHVPFMFLSCPFIFLSFPSKKYSLPGAMPRAMLFDTRSDAPNQQKWTSTHKTKPKAKKQPWRAATWPRNIFCPTHWKGEDSFYQISLTRSKTSETFAEGEGCCSCSQECFASKTTKFIIVCIKFQHVPALRQATVKSEHGAKKSPQLIEFPHRERYHLRMICISIDDTF